MDPFVAQIQTNYLKDKLDKIENTEPDKALVNALKEILRNQVPTAWKDYEDLYRTAIACVVKINLFHPDLMGRRSDRGGLLMATTEFAQQAEMIAKSGIQELGGELEGFVLQVAHIIGTTADFYENEKARGCGDVLQKDPQQVYVDSLRGLCMEFPDTLSRHFHRSFQPVTGITYSTHLYRELAAYKTQLPVDYASSILVRASSEQLYLVRACIIGPEGTPYANGVFFFDIFLDNYPQEPPKVKFLTTGDGKYRQNPNLYTDGKVCLSLLGTWQGEPWQPGKSTLLQVLVSIQSLILVNDPYFNEPGYEASRGTPIGDQASKAYNTKLYHQVADAAILDPLQDPKIVPLEFKEVVNAHFLHKQKEIETQLQGWTDLDRSKMHKLLKGYQKFWANNPTGN